MSGAAVTIALAALVLLESLAEAALARRIRRWPVGPGNRTAP